MPWQVTTHGCGTFIGKSRKPPRVLVWSNDEESRGRPFCKFDRLMDAMNFVGGIIAGSETLTLKDFYVEPYDDESSKKHMK